MDKEYSFKYGRLLLAAGITFLIFIPAMYVILELIDVIAINANLLFLTIFASVVLLYGPMVFLTEGKGVGVLHEDYAELHLGMRKIEVKYSSMKDIKYLGIDWIIVFVEDENTRILKIGEPFPAGRAKELRIFMDAFREKVKAYRAT